jgi:glycerol-3-phosphate cytidylyltransferase-like family protein
MKQVVIMPGGFHPFHAGHAALYQSAKKAFPGADVYVAATNDTSTRPFPFAIKEKLARLAGVEPGHFVQVKSPFQAAEITQKFNPEDTQLIFVRSDKDANKPPQAGGVKKNGEPAYLQPYNKNSTAPMSKYGYMAYLPTVEFGPGMTSATEIRSAWPKLNEKRRTALVMSLYPAAQKNPKLAANVVQMLDTAIGTEVAESRGEVSDPELRRTKAYARGHYTGIGNDPENAFDKWVQRSLMHSDHDDKEQDKILQALSFKVKQLETELQHLQKPVDENQGWAATYESDGITVGTGVTGGMHASYQDRYNQPTMEDYVEERRS